MDHIENNYGDEYNTIGKMLESGTLSRSFVPYLIKDGDTIVQRDSQDRSAYIAYFSAYITSSRERPFC